LTIAEHLCGTVIAYATKGSGVPKMSGVIKAVHPVGSRPQGSLINYQKRQVANAVEWIRLNKKHGAKIFVCTTSHKWDYSDDAEYISTFTHNMRNTYQLGQYVWVKEHNSHGAAHWHFVADLPWLTVPQIKQISVYWSSLFGEYARNSVRFGSKPDKDGKRIFEIEDKGHARYLSKYFGKGFNHPNALKSTARKFGISKTAAELSGPKLYHAQWLRVDQEEWEKETRARILQRFPGVEKMKAFGESFIRNQMKNYSRHFTERIFKADDGSIFNATLYTWKQAGEHTVWFARPR